MQIDDAPAIRPIEADDVTTVAAFLNMCWRAAYTGILDDGFLAGLTTEGRADSVRQKMSRGVYGWLAVDAGGAIGAVVMVGPTHLHIIEDAGEISLLYVHPSRIGTGLGHRLLLLGEAALQADGYKAIELDAYAGNARALQFYRDHGYQKVGAKQDHIAGRTYDLDIMGKLNSPPPEGWQTRRG